MRTAVWPARCKYNECVRVHPLDKWPIYIIFSSMIPSLSVFIIARFLYYTWQGVGGVRGLPGERAREALNGEDGLWIG